MNVTEARELIKTAVSEAVALASSQGFEVIGRTYFTDKNLSQINEFNEKVILLFGSIEIGYTDIDREDFCTYALCCEIKTGIISDEELENEIADFKRDVAKLLAEISSAPDKKAKLLEINTKQELEAESSFAEFNSQVRKMRLKLYIAGGALLLIILAIFGVSFFMNFIN